MNTQVFPTLWVTLTVSNLNRNSLKGNHCRFCHIYRFICIWTIFYFKNRQNVKTSTFLVDILVLFHKLSNSLKCVEINLNLWNFKSLGNKRSSFSQKPHLFSFFNNFRKSWKYTLIVIFKVEKIYTFSKYLVVFCWDISSI